MNPTESVPMDIVSEEGQDSARYVGGVSDVFNVTIVAENVSTTTGVMLIDLSDTVNWPHTETGHINVKWLQVNINPDNLFRGAVAFGFLDNVDATDGDFCITNQYNFFRASSRIDLFKYFEASHFCLKPAHWFGPCSLNDVLFQTDVNLLGPDGTVAYPSGDLDMVAKITQTAGSVDINFTIGYETVSGV